MAVGRVFDTNYLIGAWNRHGPPQSLTEARERAKQFLNTMGSGGILSPIRLEFLSGARTKQELRLYDAFLDQFEVLDLAAKRQRGVRAEDWTEAERLVRRVPPDGKPRHLADCLIRAIANRLGVEVLTNDAGFPRG
ncbi:MAG: PIN domain-containing protein [Phycisphaerales bacterium]